MKKSFLTALIFVAALVAAKPASADYGCSGQYGQYGGCPSNQSILLDKMVGKVVTVNEGTASVEYVDNLSPSDPRFKPGAEVWFQLKVKNTSNNQLTNVKIVDYVPSYVTPVDGPQNSSYDESTHQLTITVGNLNANEEQTYTLKMKVVATTALPADKGLMCVVNNAKAYNDQVSSADSSQFCIEKQVIGITQVPSTGPEFGLALLAGESIALATGAFLKKIRS